MILLNYLTSTFLIIIEFVNSDLIIFLSNHIFEGVIITTIIYLATKAKLKGVLDATAKVVGIAAGSTILYNNWVRSESSSSPDNNDEDKKK